MDYCRRMKETLNQKEAVAFIGVTEKTLYRYRRAGKLAYREVPTGRRPAIEYDLDDLKVLKEEIDYRKATRTKPEKASKTKKPRIIFGVPCAESLEILEEAKRCGMKLGPYVRQLTLSAKKSDLLAIQKTLREEMQETSVALETLRSDTANALRGIWNLLGLPFPRNTSQKSGK
jgi:hypothetical protein